jgi:N-acetylmuramoyl-L-alanine amidase
MPSRTGRSARAAGSLLAWIGILLMVTSFAWLQWISYTEKSSYIAPPTRHEPFAIVVLDPGHGGQDSGAVVGSVNEKDLTLDVAQRLNRLLQAQGMVTVMTRADDHYVSLAERATLTNKVADCILVSIHFNEGDKKGSTGIETYYADHQVKPSPPLVSWLPFLQRAAVQLPNLESQTLAGCVQEALVVRTRTTDRGTKAQQFFVIANVRHPAVLVEGGFLSNKDDATKLSTPEYRDQMAEAISDGILHYRDLLRQRSTTLAVGTAAPAE